MASVKVNVSFDEELLKRLDAFADANYMSRSGAVAMACIKLVNENDMMSAIKSIAFSMRKIADTGQVDEETLAILRNFEQLSKMVSEQFG